MKVAEASRFPELAEKMALQCARIPFQQKLRALF
jgi:hypothetical protein